MIVDELRQAIEVAQQQSEIVQRHIAEMIAFAIEEAQWDDLVSTPESQAFLAQLAQEAREANGTARDLNELL
ncbi:MAG: hypothetical protein ABI068_02345 [Ktedonobacterales bacterium]